MSDSFTLTLTGNTSILEANYFPPIELIPTKQYVIGLVELLTFNSIPNIDEGCNMFYIQENTDNTTAITLPTGSYEIEDIEKYIQKHLKSDTFLTLRSNNNELRSEIKCNKPINFNMPDSIGPVLGFAESKLDANVTHKSDLPVAILKINSLRVDCHISTGAYNNAKMCHTIHEFFPTVPPGYKIVEVPSQIIYLPIVVQAIRHLQLKIVDQDDKLVNLRGEIITIRLHIKSL